MFNILNYLFFILFTLSCIFPFYYIFINTISNNELVKKGVITFFPQQVTIQNYIMMANVNDLWNSFVVTIFRTLIGTVLMVFRLRTRRLPYDKAGDVAQKVLVQIPRYHNVLQRRTYPYIPQPFDARSYKYVPRLYHSCYRFALARIQCH